MSSRSSSPPSSAQDMPWPPAPARRRSTSRCSGYGIGAGDEVVTVPFTFIASANSILYTGARPVFVDVDERDFTMDVDADRVGHHPAHAGDHAGQPVRAAGRHARDHRDRGTARAGGGRGRVPGTWRVDRTAAQRHVGRRDVQLLPDQEHDDRRGRHADHRRRRAGRARQAAARARHEGAIPPRHPRLQLPDDRYRCRHRPRPAAEAGGCERAAPRHRRPL